MTRIQFIYSTRTIFSFFLILTAISTVGAIDFTFDSPSSVSEDSEFSVSITVDSSDSYDVKIFAENEGKTISQIYSNGWKSSYYYIKSVFPSQKEFKLKISNFSGETQICARLRETGKSSFNEKCNPLTVKKSEQANQPEEKTKQSPQISEDKKQKSKEAPRIEEKQKQTAEEQSNKMQTSNEPVIFKQEEETNEKIILNPTQSTENTKTDIFLTKTEKTRLSIIYGFSFFTLIIIILLALRKL